MKKNKLNNTNNPSGLSNILKDCRRDAVLYAMFIPLAVYYVMFFYIPMYGALMAFQDYSPQLGIMGSPWVGLSHFTDFFTNHYFGRILKNTLVISLNSIAFGFPAPLILALLLNEMRCKWYKKTVQTITYMPHFISIVVICGMIKNFTADTGFISDIIAFFGGEKVNLLNEPKYFVPIYVISGIWQSVGWDSIIYIAAFSGIDSALYEAAMIDGAGKWKQMWHVTLPGILPTVMILLILRLGSVIGVGYEKIILLYNPATYETADVISTYVYRQGLLDLQWSYSTAVGLFNSVVNFAFLIIANKVSKKLSEISLW